jgi:hypothetical protein
LDLQVLVSILYPDDLSLCLSPALSSLYRPPPPRILPLSLFIYSDEALQREVEIKADNAVAESQTHTDTQID